MKAHAIQDTYDPLHGKSESSDSDGPADMERVRLVLDKMMERKAKAVEVGPPRSDPYH
jgi:hypothetical protein